MLREPSADPPGEPDGGPEPPKPTVVLDRTRLGVRVVGSDVLVVGREGAVSPGGATLQAVNLSREAESTTARARDDGSFELPSPVAGSDVARLLAFAGGGVSPPVDVVLAATGDETRLADAVLPLAACLALTPQVIDFGPRAAGEGLRRELRIDNRCASAVAIGEASFRPAESAFRLVDAPPASLGAGQSAVLGIVFTTSEARPFATSLVLRIDGPEAGIRAVLLTSAP
jgi:hypothetical protein